VALLAVLTVVLGLYVQQAVAYFSAKSQADQQHAIVQTLRRQNAQLVRQQKALNNPGVIQHDARELGMVRQGEQPYVLMGLPGH
jgi:cell division protein FtsB